ncbi:YihY/virulence factor BrkB family protein [Actinacidiphila acidipaludis]|uniref:YihY/virulence factor BrkB family protein n=1 Tax=Actinacidiphila acidipaludis TaxID=2873382 RepID=A0ABS7Q5W8_9ACTN|nr:YihY/virulence factor BrkB family protein [Streptomyces acidipaludis]MBY8878236.1 YihY/virulence factor BrkB family protein [Streptomyces acidipaludis]
MALESSAAQPKGAVRSGTTWWIALRRVPVAMWDDNVADWAAALTYYAVLALVPALLVTLSLIGLISPDLTDRLIGNVTALAPAQASGAFRETLTQMAHERSAALTVAITGGVASLWSATSHLAVFRRALHAMHGIPDRRPMWRRLHRIILTALSLLALLVTSALVLVLTGPLAEALGRDVGLGRAATATWYLLRWPMLLCLVGLTVLILFRSGPPAARTARHAVPGGVLATVLWLITSAAFSLYTSVFGTYGRLYGSLAGAVVFLVWLWLSHLALLAGAQFAVELGTTERDGAGAV